jgi:hypothetical protein
MKQMIFKTEEEYNQYCKENNLVGYILEPTKEEAAMEMFEFRFKYRPVIEAIIKGVSDINIAGVDLAVKEPKATPDESEYIL